MCTSDNSTETSTCYGQASSYFTFICRDASKATETVLMIFEKFSIKNGVKQDDLSPLLFNFCFYEYYIRKVRENTEGLKLDLTHQILVYVDVSTLDASIHTNKE